MNQTHVMMEDATCYETQMRYPTNVKLLWESVDWMYHQMGMMCKHCKIRMPRSKYLEQKQKYFNYQRKRKKLRKERIKRTRSLLLLLDKLNGQLDEQEEQFSEGFAMPAQYDQRRKVIRKVYRQQLEMFPTGESIPDRIVSLSKSYIRPIVRGKEVKKVEFGAKVNTIQIDGFNFIEHLSFIMPSTKEPDSNNPSGVPVTCSEILHTWLPMPFMPPMPTEVTVRKIT